MRTDSPPRRRAEGYNGPRGVCTDSLYMVDTASPRLFAEQSGIYEVPPVPYVKSGNFRNDLLGCLKDMTIMHLCRRPAITCPRSTALSSTRPHFVHVSE